MGIHCFGYGSDHDSGLLQEIAEATEGGNYYFIENDDNVGTAFGDALGGILSVVAQSAVLTIEVPPETAVHGVKIFDVYHDKKIKRENGTYTVNVGDFYAEETRDVVFDIQLAPNDGKIVSTCPMSHANVTLTYTDTIKKCHSKVGPTACKIARPTGSKEISKSNSDVEEQYFRIMATKGIAMAEIEAKAGNLSGAQKILQGSISRLECGSSLARSSSMIKQLKSDISTVQKSFANNSEYEKRGKHMSKKMGKTWKMQRSNCASLQEKNFYKKSHQAYMAINFQGASLLSQVYWFVTEQMSISFFKGIGI